MATPLISVIIAVYNGEHTIRHAVASVLEQTVSDLELIVVDDGSTDATNAVLATIADPRLRCLTQVNSGAGTARNAGLAIARGTYIAFLDDDDRWLPQKLAADLAVFEALDDPVAMVYGGYYAVNDDGVTLHRSKIHSYFGHIFDVTLRRENFLIPSVTAYHRTIFDTLGGFCAGRLHEDQEFMLRATQRYPAYPTGQRQVVYRQTMSGKCRGVLRSFDDAYRADMEIVDLVAERLTDEQAAELRMRAKRGLALRFLMYGFPASARRLLSELPWRFVASDLKGILALVSFYTRVNFLMAARLTVQGFGRRLADARQFCPLYQHEPGKRPGAAERTVMIVSDHLPGHQAALEHSGAAHYLEGFIDYFTREGFRVVWLLVRPRLDVTSLNTADLDYELIGPEIRHIAEHYVVSSPAGILTTLLYRIFRALPDSTKVGIRNVRMALRNARGFAHVMGTKLSPRETRAVRRAAAGFAPDVILYDGIFNYCAGLGARSHWIVTYDVLHERVKSFRSHGFEVLPRNFQASDERAILEKARNVIAIQRTEAEIFRRLAPNCRVVTVPISFTTRANSAIETDVRRCIFVGSASLHNVDGINWFLENCWATIRRDVPDATLDIYGSVCLGIASVPAGVRVHGVVEDLSTAYQGAAIAIIPLRIGSGLKVKIVESLSYGVPVVSTSIGVQGLDHLEPAPYVLADGADAFAGAVRRVLSDRMLRDTLAEHARAAAMHFTAEFTFAEFTEALASDLGGKKRSSPPTPAGVLPIARAR